MYENTEFQDFTQSLVRNLMRSSTLTVQITRFVKQQAEEAVAGKAKLRRDVSQKIPVREERTALLPLTDRSPVSSKSSKDDQHENNKDKSFPHHHSKFSYCSKCGSGSHTDNYEVDIDDEGRREVKVLKPVNSHSTACKNSFKSTIATYRIQ